MRISDWSSDVCSSDLDRAGARAASLRYLTPGLGWNADYVALYDEKARKIDVQGWVTLTNNSGTTYNNAETLLVAGSVNQSGNRDVRPMIYPPRPLQRQNIRQAGTEPAEREQLGDYYLYQISGRTTITARPPKQASFLDVKAGPGHPQEKK